MTAVVPSTEVRRARPEDRAGILDLLAGTMGWAADRRHHDLYAWKHDESPFGTSPTWVAVAEERVVGLRTWLRWRFVGRGRTWTAVRAVDTATHPDVRGQGIFTRLTTQSVQELTEDGVDLVFNTPNDQSLPGYLKMGWEELGRAPMSARFRTPATAVRSLAARRPAELWSVPVEVGERPEVAFGDDRVTAWLDHAPRDDGRLRTDLTPDVLRWRYGLGDLHYRVLAEGDRGCVVFRVRRRGPSTEAVVCQTLTADERVRARLLRQLVRTTGVDHAVAITDRPAWRAGFVPLPGQGPLVTWRPLATTSRLQRDDLALVTGDVELF